MLFNLEKRIGVILVPKTGTSALHSVLADKVQLDYSKHGHSTVEQFEQILANDGHTVTDARYFSLFRDPIDWFLSACNYFKATDPNFKINLLEASSIKKLTYFERRGSLAPYQELIDNLSIAEVVKALISIRDSGHADKISKQLQMWRLQSEYLDHPNVSLLDYRDMVGSVNTVLDAFEVDRVTSVPIVNPTIKVLHTRDNITAADKLAIQEYCSTDYEFFEKKGIFFEV